MTQIKNTCILHGASSGGLSLVDKLKFFSAENGELKWDSGGKGDREEAAQAEQ